MDSKKNGLIKMDQSKKIRQGRMIRTDRFAFSLLLACMVFSIMLLLPGMAQATYRVAIFDFDQREVTPDLLARHTENKLRKMFKDIEVDHYSGQGDENRSIQILQEIEAKGYDLAITRTSDALIIARHTLFKTPTLYTNVNNPLLLGFKTLGPPGGNISGASYYIPIEKHLRVYTTIMPTMHRPGFIFDLNNKSRKVEVPEIRDACAALGLKFVMEFINDKSQLQGAVKALKERGADAIIATSSGTIYENIHIFLQDANRAGLPVFSFYKTGVPEGAVAALSSDFFRMADELIVPMAKKVLVDKVSPGDLPAAFLKKNNLFINRSQADRFSLAIPPELRQEHDVVYIETPTSEALE